MAMRPVGTESRSASASVAARTVWMQTAGGSVRRLPAACPGNSTRSTATPVRLTASSMATSPDCSRPALAPGVSTSPAIPAVAIGPSWRAWQSRDVDSTQVRRRLADTIGPVDVGPAARRHRLPGRGGWAPARRQGRAGLPAMKPRGCASSARRPEGHRCPPWCSRRPISSSPPPSTRCPARPGTSRRSGAAWRGCTGRRYPHWGGGSAWVGACRVDPPPGPTAPPSTGLVSSTCPPAADSTTSSARGRTTWTNSSRPVARSSCTVTSGGATSYSGATAAHGSSTRPSTAGTPRRTWPCSLSSARCRTGCSRPMARSNPCRPGGRSGSALFQLAPLLVHAVLFGGGYRARAEAVARRFA